MDGAAAARADGHRHLARGLAADRRQLGELVVAHKRAAAAAELADAKWVGPGGSGGGVSRVLGRERAWWDVMLRVAVAGAPVSYGSPSTDMGDPLVLI